MSRTSIRYVSAIARALHHKCAPTPLQEAQAQSLAELHEMMYTNHMRLRVNRERRNAEQWIPGRQYVGTPNLIHETATGRLKIEATEEQVDLDFWAGIIEDRSGGRLVATLRISENDDGSAKIGVVVVNGVLERPDRVALLVDIDKEVDGEISQYLRNPDPGDAHLCQQLLQAMSGIGKCTACGGSGLKNLDFAFQNPCARCHGTGVEPTKQTTQA